MAYGERLGCAHTYTATVHYRGGQQVYAYLDTVESLEWERVRRGVSEATVTLHKSRISPGCRGRLADLWPWVHEVTIYRNQQAVWQGPLLNIVEGRTTLVLTARDCGAYLEKRVLRKDDKLTDADLSNVARAVVESALSDHDDIGVLDQVASEPSGKTGSRTIRAFSRMGWDELEEVAEEGVEVSFVGRRLAIGPVADEDTPAQGRITSDDLLGEPEMEMDGEEYASLVYAAPQAQENIWNHLEAVGGTSPYFGLVEHVVQTSHPWRVDDDGDFDPQGDDGLSEQETIEALQRTAEGEFEQRSRPPIVLRVSDQSHLSADAPISLDRLIPGVRIDLALGEDFTLRVQRAMRLMRVSVSYDTSGEQVGVSLVQIGTESDAEVNSSF